MSDNKSNRNSSTNGKAERIEIKETTRDGADFETQAQFAPSADGEYNRAGDNADSSAPVKGERVLEYRAKIDKERIDVVEQDMQAEEYVVQKQKLALQKDGHKEKVASFKTPEQCKMTGSGHMAREKISDTTKVTHVGPTEKLADVIKTDGITGERVQVFKKKIDKEHVEVYKEDLEQEKIVIAKEKLAMKPVGKEAVTEVLETDDMATGAHKLAATTTTTKHKEKLHKTLDLLSTEDEKGQQKLLDSEQAEQVLKTDREQKKKQHHKHHHKRSDSASSSSSSSSSSEDDNEQRNDNADRKHGHKKHHGKKEEEKIVVATAVAKDNGDREEVKVHVEEIRPSHG